jgi:endonuclease YncB( thermonuclease family)
MRPHSYLFFSFAFLIFTGSAYPAELVGRVVAVSDGDTLTLLVEKMQVRVRLAEIDAPEKSQPFSSRSRQSLHALCHGKMAKVQNNGKDRYSRVIGHVTCDTTDANTEQIRRGMAWVYDRYARPNSPLYALQEHAQKSKVGLWIDAQPVPPWVWRRSKRHK